MTLAGSDPFAMSPIRRFPLVLTGVLLMGLLGLGASEGRAQVQIDQVQSVASQIEGATQGQVVVTLPGGDCAPAGEASCGAVDRSKILNLLPGGVPTLADNTSGNSAVVFQDGNDNDATINQRGSGNQASITQLNGDDNDASVVQEPGDGFPGENNLAVIVQDGSYNQTTIRQRGRNNVAGIKLDGNSNGIALEQTGHGHGYLLDFTGSGLSSAHRTATHRVQQLGRNNQLVQVGENSMPFNIRQRGSDMRMVIRHRAK